MQCLLFLHSLFILYVLSCRRKLCYLNVGEDCSVSGYYLSFTTRVHVLVKLSYLTGG